MRIDIPKDQLNNFLNQHFNLIKENQREIKGENWKIRSYDIKIKKDNSENITRIYGIEFNNATVGVSLTNDGKLKNVVFYDFKEGSETDETVKKIARNLTINYEANKVFYIETEIELFKGKSGLDAIKSISIVKKEEYNL
ncbi:hypothetical protein [Saccharolobus caldissimus]|uniref:Uncharacterized protein n=1 Tax=Saccharolobus caldissimus TaxID=1702097 RepID=A0AAQ4CRN2_9CREN|nr:hypothetical protein [Saccharolobus caldissimus]BDB98463.1 hypothetical protein SACC_14800 [Saccharolobus caldissimus]